MRQNKLFYGWIIVGILGLITMVVYAVSSSFPLFYVPIINQFGWSRAETALISSTYSIVYGLGGVVTGALLDRFGPRKLYTTAALVMVVGLIGCSLATERWQLFLFWGGVMAFGVSAAGFVPTNALISNWFARKRATAVGIAQAIGRESSLLMPVVQLLILTLNWQKTVMVLAIPVAIMVTVLAQFLRRSPSDIGLLPDGASQVEGIKEKEKTEQRRGERVVLNQEWATTDWTLLKGIKKYRFWALFFTYVAYGTTAGIALTHQVAFMVDVGFTAMFASVMLVIFGISGMAGRISGFVSDITGREVAYTLSTGGMIIGFIMLSFTRGPSTVWMLYIYVILFGFCSGINMPTYIAAAADIFQGMHFGAILGFLNMAYGFGTSFGAWLGGYVFDTYQSYVPAFVLAVLMLIPACASVWIASPRKIRAVGQRASRMKLAN